LVDTSMDAFAEVEFSRFHFPSRMRNSNMVSTSAVKAAEYHVMPK